VNVATRIQQEAEPDSICASGVFFDNIRRNSPFAFDDLGERRLKNLAEPIRIYRLREKMARHRLQSTPTRAPPAGEKRPLSLAVSVESEFIARSRRLSSRALARSLRPMGQG
jgi:adenylate cyclase